MMTDPVADMLTRIRNAIHAGHSSVIIPSSKLKLAVARILREEGFIQNYDVIPDRRQPKIRVWLKYLGERRERKCVISGIKRVSKPGCRVYVGKGEIPWVLSGVGVAISGSGVTVAVGGGVWVSVGRMNCTVGTMVSSGVKTAVCVKLAGVI